VCLTIPQDEAEERSRRNNLSFALLIPRTIDAKELNTVLFYIVVTMVL
jgi:hypothetical protein